MEPLVALVVVVKLVALVLGGVVSVLAYRAYRRTRIAGLQYFSVGLLVITLGTVLVGVFHHFLGVPTTMGMLLESVIVCAGFGVMIVGLYEG
ncbi:DUF7521 family protein [Halococcus saccharolyticus]|uniref:YapH protein n=1 Tax=Halococcus saccharolyticus DSM 5350 TaxID=1227455 RepID=M0MEG2_9EURY|nr:hypothetical protein [Halococcus saccharolyticus]EMA42805.1 hypothetical protein C449_16723 [Halococcus saccharolyticus DSM 5350]